MSRLRIFSDTTPERVEIETRDHAEMAGHLGDIGVRFEQWQANQPIQPGDSQEKVLAAYHDDIQSLMDEKGYRSVDVISLNPDHPDRAVFRKKFLDEHTHSEDEVRFFVAGSGVFTLHVNDKVYEVLCEAGDLIGVPDGTRHWFDMGPAPYFVAIRLFTNTEGWVANFTGTDIAGRFPRYENTGQDQAA